MSTSSLDHKTVRPGSLVGYSYYHSDRHNSRPVAAPIVRKNRPSFKLPLRWIALAAIVLAVLAVPLLRSDGNATKVTQSSAPTAAAQAPKTAAAPAVAAATVVNHCQGNQGKVIKVNITQRHLWACEGTTSVYDSPVITGMTQHPDTVTPTGTYHIYGKQTNTTLTGSDAAGSWSDPVSYWMPFLNNQYGTYGFHDATWRANNDFGKIDPNSSDASHGCVELPIATSKWLYNWSVVGTALTIES